MGRALVSGGGAATAPAVVSAGSGIVDWADWTAAVSS